MPNSSLRKGEIKKLHFAHKISSICRSESVLHKTAKKLIKDRIESWLKELSDSPIIKRECFICFSDKEQELPESKVDEVELEYRLENGYIVDVVLLKNNEPVAGIEIKVTHEVDEEKQGCKRDMGKFT